MAEYELLSDGTVRRTADGACIPADPGNRDYAAYLAWQAGGGVAPSWSGSVAGSDFAAADSTFAPLNLWQE